MTELSARDAIVTELSPAEAAEFLGQLVRGYQSAYQAAAETYGSHRYLPAWAMAEDLDRLALDEHWASYATGLRHPGETTAFQHRAPKPSTPRPPKWRRWPVPSAARTPSPSRPPTWSTGRPTGSTRPAGRTATAAPCARSSDRPAATSPPSRP